MDRYVCSICGETYNPKEGLPQYGIDPGILFEDLPDDWFCPMCGAEKQYFEKEK
jgi:rubredoxin